MFTQPSNFKKWPSHPPTLSSRLWLMTLCPEGVIISYNLCIRTQNTQEKWKLWNVRNRGSKMLRKKNLATMERHGLHIRFGRLGIWDSNVRRNLWSSNYLIFIFIFPQKKHKVYMCILLILEAAVWFILITSDQTCFFSKRNGWDTATAKHSPLAVHCFLLIQKLTPFLPNFFPLKKSPFPRAPWARCARWCQTTAGSDDSFESTIWVFAKIGVSPNHEF